jgi:DNA-binding MarR family transcriptional regulator
LKIEEAIQQKTFRSSKQKAFVNILYTSSWLYAQHREIFKDLDITMQQYNVLRILAGQKGGSLSTCDIRNRMLDRSSDASRLVDKLSKQGYVSRVVCEADRRRVDVALTEAGATLLNKMAEQVDSADNAISLSDEEALLLSHLLDKLRGSESYSSNGHISEEKPC